MNRQTLKVVLKAKIDHLYGMQFNDVINGIFSVFYGENYTSVKQKKDMGSDGIIETEKICLACYAPEKYNKQKFRKKVDEDYEKYEKHYMRLGYKWRFITNQKLLGSMIIDIKNKSTNADVWGIEELINFVLNLPPNTRRKILLEIFHLSPDLIEFDFIEEIIEEILKLKKDIPDYHPRYDIPKDTLEKIETNFSGEDIEIVKRKFINYYAEHIDYLQKVLNTLDNDFISNMKMTVLREYQLLNMELTFKKKFEHLVNRFSTKYPNDQEYKNYVELILLYLFEQCLIGAKTGVSK